MQDTKREKNCIFIFSSFSSFSFCSTIWTRWNNPGTPYRQSLTQMVHGTHQGAFIMFATFFLFSPFLGRKRNNRGEPSLTLSMDFSRRAARHSDCMCTCAASNTVTPSSHPRPAPSCAFNFRYEIPNALNGANGQGVPFGGALDQSPFETGVTVRWFKLQAIYHPPSYDRL